MHDDLCKAVENSPWPLEAFEFVHRGLDHALKHLPDGPRHISGQELCHALRAFAIERYGPLARFVLGRWGIHETLDFGQIVYTCIEYGLMSRTDGDCLEDFEEIFAFESAFPESLQSGGVDL